MDPVMTQLLLAACGLPHGHASLDRRVHTLDDLRELAGLPLPWRALTDEAGLLRRWCHSNRLDPDRYLRQIGFLEPEDRPVEAAVPTAPAGVGGRAG
jgi:hypothetical protein